MPVRSSRTRWRNPVARLRGHQALDLSRPVTVKRGPLTFGGRIFVGGELLPWRDLGLSRRKLTQLWEQRRIGHEKLDARAGAEPPVVKKQRRRAKAAHLPQD